MRQILAYRATIAVALQGEMHFMPLSHTNRSQMAEIKRFGV
jgi:hypothetical protein